MAAPTATQVRALFRQIATDQRALASRLDAAVLAYAQTPLPPIDIIPTTPNPPPAPTGAITQSLKVKGNLIVGSTTGRRIVPRGTNFYGVKAYPRSGNADGQMAPVNAWHQRNAVAIASQCATWGINSVRLLSSGDLNITPNIKLIGEANAAAGIYTMVCAFDNSFGAFDANGGQARGAYLAQVYKDCGSPAWMYVNLANEPHAIDDNQWAQFSAAGVSALRSGGFPGVIVLDGNVWAHRANFAQIKSIPDANLALGLHAYAYEGSGAMPANNGPDMVAQWVADQSVCCLVGEWGPFNGRFGGNGTMQSAVDVWCKPMAQVVVQAVATGQIAGQHNWALVWDGNSQLDAATPSPEGNRDWWGITSTPFPNYQLNPWGQVAQKTWMECAAIPT